jgi:hypothetical protein
MPAYEYFCKDCNHEVTVFLSIKEFEAKPKIKCLIVRVIMCRKKSRNLLQRQAKNHSLCGLISS